MCANTHSHQFQLDAARQLTIDGQAEPLFSAVDSAVEIASFSVDAASNDVAVAQTDWLKPDLQLPLPLATRHHKTADGNLNPECLAERGYAVSFCLEHPGQLRPGPRLCGHQACESSREANTKERARDAWNGTADDEAMRVALRHFDPYDFGIFVFTLPSELRERCVRERLKAFRREAGEMALEVIARNGAQDGQLYARGWLHPVGEAGLPKAGEAEADDGTEYKPHENVLVPLVAWRDGRAQRVKSTLPRSWLGADGWVGKRWLERLVTVFGKWWEGDTAPVLNWFYEFRAKPEQKQHALRYFSRVFPAWAKHPDVPLRPRAIGLAHWKHKPALVALTAGHAPAPKYGACVHGTAQAPCPEPLHVSADSEERAVEVAMHQLTAYRMQRVANASGAGGLSYVQSWRIMASGDGPGGPAPPRTGPPKPETPFGDSVWGQFSSPRS